MSYRAGLMRWWLSMRSRCENCGGKRTVLGMGGLVKQCDDCEGTGWKKEVMLCAPSIHLDKRSKEYRESKKQQSEA